MAKFSKRRIIYSKLYIFLPLLKKSFGRFLKNAVFRQKSDYLNRFFVKFLF